MRRGWRHPDFIADIFEFGVAPIREKYSGNHAMGVFMRPADGPVPGSQSWVRRMLDKGTTACRNRRPMGLSLTD